MPIADPQLEGPVIEVCGVAGVSAVVAFAVRPAVPRMASTKREKPPVVLTLEQALSRSYVTLRQDGAIA